MATITANQISNQDQQWYIKWAAMGNADTGTGVEFGQFPDRTVGITGTFGGATVTIQGSVDNTNWVTLHDFLGNTTVYTAGAIALLAENPLYIRAITSGGSGTAVDVYLLGSRA
jgi:hypothetical protein